MGSIANPDCSCLVPFSSDREAGGARLVLQWELFLQGRSLSASPSSSIQSLCSSTFAASLPPLRDFNAEASFCLPVQQLLARPGRRNAARLGFGRFRAWTTDLHDQNVSFKVLRLTRGVHRVQGLVGSSPSVHISSQETLFDPPDKFARPCRCLVRSCLDVDVEIPTDKSATFLGLRFTVGRTDHLNDRKFLPGSHGVSLKFSVTEESSYS